MTVSLVGRTAAAGTFNDSAHSLSMSPRVGGTQNESYGLRTGLSAWSKQDEALTVSILTGLQRALRGLGSPKTGDLLCKKEAMLSEMLVANRASECLW